MLDCSPCLPVFSWNVTTNWVLFACRAVSFSAMDCSSTWACCLSCPVVTAGISPDGYTVSMYGYQGCVQELTNIPSAQAFLCHLVGQCFLHRPHVSIQFGHCPGCPRLCG